MFFAAQALAAMGARVEIALGGENLVRSLSSGAGDPDPSGLPDPTDPADPARDRAAEPRPTALVQAEGLPNLLHELVHAVQAGRLDDDYGIDYSAIPFDLDTPAGRAVLWDELACCVISCAYLHADRHARAPGRAVRAEVEDWFAEQVEIQPVFYGMEADPPAFGQRVAELLRAHGPEAHAVLERAYAATAQALRAAGADPDVAIPSWRPPLDALWSRLGWRHSAADLA